MKRGSVTSVDVAIRAGVSQSAVSRVFSSNGSVSQTITAKVRKAAEELGYRPNFLARSLITGRSRIIGLVVSYLDNQFYPEALQKISIELQRHGYHVMVFTPSEKEMDADRVIGEFLDYQVDGIICASVTLSNPIAERCAAADIPVVLFNRGQGDPRLSEITEDNFAAGAEIGRYLVSCGHKKIAQITGDPDTKTSCDRQAGFEFGISEQGVRLFDTQPGNFSRETAMEVARDMFGTSNRPDAVFVANDHMAFGVVDVLKRELGLRLPNDVAVVGFDDVSIASWTAYDLTTWHQPLDEMVIESVSTILDRITGVSPPSKHQKIRGHLVQRGTTHKLKDWNDRGGPDLTLQ